MTNSDSIIRLHHPPLLLFAKLDKTRIASLEGLGENDVAIEPVHRAFRVDFKNMEQDSVTRMVHQSQLPIIPAYAWALH
jgi:hypothetical protein